MSSTSDIDRALWRKAERSKANGDCVEVGPVPGKPLVLVRDTKDHGAGLVLGFNGRAWQEFLAGAKAGEFDLE